MPRPLVVFALIGALLLAGCKSTRPSYVGSTAENPWTRWCEDHPAVTSTGVLIGVGVAAALAGIAYLYLYTLDGEDHGAVDDRSLPASA